MTCGIYCLYFETDDGQFYIGESINIEKRFKGHCSALKGNRHDTYKIQNNYAHNGLPSISIIEVVEDSTTLKNREVYWIKEFDSFNDGMNLTKGGDGCGYGDTHPSSLYTKEDYIKVLLLLANTDKTQKEVSQETGVSYNVVIQISIGKTHYYLAEEYPEEWARVQGKVGSRKSGTVSIIPEESLKALLELLVYSDLPHKEIADKIGVSETLVKSICIGYSHKDLKSRYPIQYALLEARQAKSCYTKIKRPNLISPEGEICEVGNNVTLWCKSKGLDQRAISAVLLGKRSQHKGWKVYNDPS